MIVSLSMRTWVYDPQSGGNKIKPALKEELLEKAEKYATKRPELKDYDIVFRFRSPFCYIGARKKGEKEAFPLCRLRYFRGDIWSMAVFTWSNEEYYPHVFKNGSQEGTIIDALKMCHMWLPG